MCVIASEGDSIGGMNENTNSAFARMLRKPNDHRYASDFMLNLVDGLYSECNARSDR